LETGPINTKLRLKTKCMVTGEYTATMIKSWESLYSIILAKENISLEEI